jgi:hypothetical protein
MFSLEPVSRIVKREAVGGFAGVYVTVNSGDARNLPWGNSPRNEYER